MSAPVPVPPAPQGWPPEACRPPSWHLWETVMASGRKVTTKSPLADFHKWMVIARERIDRDGFKQADVFRDGWRLGTSRARRSAPPASSRQPDRFAEARRSSAAVASATTAGATERRAQPGELCTCGRPAREVFLTERHGDVGCCGLSNSAPVLPCPFCGTTEAHRQPWDDSDRCPEYRLRPATKGGGPS